jgi:tetratricopeptide (TPR) repeat protein
MNNNQPSAIGIKRVGELFVESGLLSAEDLAKGLDYARKTGLPIGRVLVMLRMVSDQEVRAALHLQSLMKFEKMPPPLAVRAIAHSRAKQISIEEACVDLGWSSEKFKAGLPERLRELKDLLAQTEGKLGSDHPELASTMIQLAAFYEDEQMWPHAEAQLESAIRILEKTYGTVDLRVAQALTKMANLLYQQDRFAEAQPFYERVLTIRQHLLGADDPDVGYALLDLAEIYDIQKSWADAEKHYLLSLQNLEHLYHCDETPILDVLKRLSYVSKKRNAPSESVLVGTLLTECGLISSEKIPEALEVSKQKSVPLGRALVTLGYLTEEQLRPVLQLQLLIKSNLLPTQIAIRILRLRVRRNVSLADAMAMVGWKTGGQSYEPSQLLSINDELLAAERDLAADDPQIAALCVQMAELFETYDRHNDAELLYKRAIGIVEKSPSDTDGLIVLLDRLGSVNVRQHKYDSALSIYARALTLRKEHMGDDQGEMATSYLNIGRLNRDRGNHAEAISHLRQALSLAENNYGPAHIEVGNIVEQLALCYFESGNHTMAEPLFWQAYKIKKEHMDKHCPEVVGLLTKLAELYNKDGNYTMADSVLVLFHPDRTGGFM